jgi:serine O-acetyltransferase
MGTERMLARGYIAPQRGRMQRVVRAGSVRRPVGETTAAPMKQTVRADLHRYGGLSGFSGLIRGLADPGFRFLFLLRGAQTHPRTTPAGVLFRVLLGHHRRKYGLQIPIMSQIGAGFYIGHVGTTVINSRAVIGRNCSVTHGVTIGQANRGRRKGVPVLGDRVWVGAGAVIVGNVRIGSNVLIAPNAYVATDVPDDSVVVGNPARIMSRADATAGYINNVLQ